MSGASVQVLNELFVQKVASAEMRDKLSEDGGSYIRDRLREVSFARKILPPQTITRADCQVSVNHDTLVKIVELEPDSRAMSLTFRGEPTAKYITGRRAEVGFFTISSEKIQKTEQELLAYTMPVTRILEDNSVKDLQEIEDREFLLNAEAAVQGLQLEANGGVATALNASSVQAASVVEYSIIKGELARTATTDDATVRPIQRGDIVDLISLLTDRRMRVRCLLMGESTWMGVLKWTTQDNGDRIQSETVVDGYKYNTLLGCNIVRSIKSDILRRGNVYAFAAPEFLGRFYILNNPKFYIDKKANLISFQCWEDVGMIIANVAAVVKLEAYSADANPVTNDDGLLANFVPVAEDALGALNNRVDAGLKFPQIATF